MSDILNAGFVFFKQKRKAAFNEQSVAMFQYKENISAMLMVLCKFLAIIIQ